MKRGLLVVGVFVLLVVAGVLINDYDKKRRLNLSQVVIPTPTPMIMVTPTETVREIKYPFKASFQIVTNGLVRSFSNAMYQNQSPQAFIPSGMPATVEVTKETTWREFFATLPFSLNEECLITGDGETLCDGEGGTLSFELNGEIAPKALSQTINSNDLLVVRYE